MLNGLFCLRSNVKDMSSVLEVTVFDEDRDHKVEFLGRVAIPLWRIHNNEKRWYALKDKKMYARAKGNSPQVFIRYIASFKDDRFYEIYFC